MMESKGAARSAQHPMKQVGVSETARKMELTGRHLPGSHLNGQEMVPSERHNQLTESGVAFHQTMRLGHFIKGECAA